MTEQKWLHDLLINTNQLSGKWNTQNCYQFNKVMTLDTCYPTRTLIGVRVRCKVIVVLDISSHWGCREWFTYCSAVITLVFIVQEAQGAHSTWSSSLIFRDSTITDIKILSFLVYAIMWVVKKPMIKCNTVIGTTAILFIFGWDGAETGRDRQRQAETGSLPDRDYHLSIVLISPSRHTYWLSLAGLLVSLSHWPQVCRII